MGHHSMAFSRIFLDTNPLHQPWPGLSIKVENILNAARKLDIAVEIPQGVLEELERNWRDRTKGDIDNAKRALANLGFVVGRADLAEVIPDWNVLHDGFKNRVNHLLDSWKIAVTPMPLVSVPYLFAQATKRELVFGDKGVNFQDGVILHSVLERLATTRDSGALVSDDGIFHNRHDELVAYARTKGAAIAFLKLADAEQHFNGLLDSEDKKRIALQRELAKEAVQEYLAKFESAFNDSLMQHARNMDMTPDGSGMLHDARFTEVVDVDLAVGETEPQLGALLRVSAIVRGTVSETVNVSRARSHWTTDRHPIEVGFIALALYQGSRYDIQDTQSVTYGWPSNPGSIGHPDWRHTIGG
jgi:hypothetical protein